MKKTIKKTALIILLSFIMTGFSQCSSTKKLQSKAPTEITEIYYQRWASGVRDGGAGVDLFISTTSKNVQLDSVYFRGRISSLELQTETANLYKARFVITKEKFDIIMSNDSLAEYGNKLPDENKPFPFDLKDQECVISYKDGKKTKYFKIEGIKEGEVKHFPMGRKQ